MSDKTTMTQVGVIANGELYKVGDLVRFKSEYQHGTALIKELDGKTVTLKGVDVLSKWGQKMVAGNSIMGHVSLIKGKAE